VRASWLGTERIFRRPVAGLLRRLAGTPVQRDRREGIVDQVVAAVAATASPVIGLTPEGTRYRTSCWKSGFCHTAVGAGVPVVPTSIDRSRRRIAVGSPLVLSG
jgi:1-acyl-sn-glycerol-3-phosphate acyltransferase